MQELCIQCKGRGFCGKSCQILASLKRFQPRINLEFSGSSPPEIFVGHYNYPHVFSGILSPAQFGNTEEFSLPEIWHEQKKSIRELLNLRSKMIYSRFTTNIKQTDKFKETMQELAMASKPTDASFKLKKRPHLALQLDRHVAFIGNPAPLEKVQIESNIQVNKKVDYLTNDKDAKATQAILELYKSGIAVSNVIKLLTAGLLGKKFQRKLVPTRWAVTATDDIVSKNLLKKIKSYSELQEYRLFNANYLGNYYEILLIPGCWSFEVIEASSSGYFGHGDQAIWQDFEFFQGRKDYANSVTGAYYTNRLAVCEYLEKMHRQASCLIFREVRPEYWAPCGVGILRETCREALSKNPEVFQNLEDAFKAMQTRLKIPITFFKEKSVLLKEKKAQKRLEEF